VSSNHILGAHHRVFECPGEGEVPLSTKVILSHHDYDETPSDEILEALVGEMFKGGADIAKIATTAQQIEDSARMLALPGKSSGRQQDQGLIKPT
jgi:3-dehydroquinate dehydratase type I